MISLLLNGNFSFSFFNVSLYYYTKTLTAFQSISGFYTDNFKIFNNIISVFDIF